MTDKNSLFFEKKFGFDYWNKKTISSVFGFAENYKEFLSKCKTERLVVDWAEKKAKERGYELLQNIGTNLRKQKFLKGKKFYNINRKKSIILARFGKKKITDGLRLVLAHIDSPRLDLKAQPLYETEHLGFLKTHYYGGIKKYQWTALPLALYGTIARQDGSVVDIEIGEKKEDPVFMISDLLIHLSKNQLEKKMEEAVKAEELNLIIGSISEINKEKSAKNAVKRNLLKILNKKYKITEEDLVSADLEIVPAGEARDLGLDSSLIAGYGQDDKICAYSAVKALFDAETPEFTSIVVLVDREEIGSEGATGATSNFIVDFVGELLCLEQGEYNENYLRDALSLSKAISADVTVGFDPDYADVFDTGNTARLGAGIALEKYTGGRGKSQTSEATAEYVAYIRNIYNKAGVNWQTGGLGKVDVGGGGTIAMFLARHNMDIIDSGPPILSMHAPFEIASKADLYSTYQAYQAFFKAK